MSDGFQLKIVDEGAVHFMGRARYCQAVTSSGSIGFEAKHEHFAGALAPGSMLWFEDMNGNVREMPVHWGVLLFQDNRCTVTLAA